MVARWISTPNLIPPSDSVRKPEKNPPTGLVPDLCEKLRVQWGQEVLFGLEYEETINIIRYWWATSVRAPVVVLTLYYLTEARCQLSFLLSGSCILIESISTMPLTEY